jgi:uncharacterized protein YjbI with pentapeptide repeats
MANTHAGLVVSSQTELEQLIADEKKRRPTAEIVNLDQLTIRNCTLNNLSFTKVSLNRTIWQRVHIADCTFEETQMVNARCEQAIFDRSDLSYIRASHARWDDCQMLFPHMDHADFSNSTWKLVSVWCFDMTHASFENGRWNDCVFLEGTVEDTDARRLVIDTRDPEAHVFVNCIVKELDLRDAQFKLAQFDPETAKNLSGIRIKKNKQLRGDPRFKVFSSRLNAPKLPRRRRIS